MTVTLAWLLLGFIVLQRLVELIWARRNTRRLLREGATEYAPKHYMAIVILHTTWLFALYFNLLYADTVTVNVYFLVAFFGLTIIRIWTLAALGPYFTTRIISPPSTPLVRSGPYRWLRHPNYVVVFGEIICVPLIFGWWHIALTWGGINGLLLYYRIRCEEEALRSRRWLPTAVS